MTPITALWLPILVSLVVVFIISSFIHMASPWHKGDFPKLANEDAVMDALRPLNLPPGDYMMPRPSSMAEMKSPEFIERVKRGPKVLMTVMPNGIPNMGSSLAGWALFILVVTFIGAHVQVPSSRPAPRRTPSSTPSVSSPSPRTPSPSGRCPSGTAAGGGSPSRSPWTA